jgi:predicted DNA-binding transcriptional regulator AlpA
MRTGSEKPDLIVFSAPSAFDNFEHHLTQKRSLDMSKRLMNSANVRARLGGISPMTLWRYQQDAKLAFPRAISIRERNFWDADEVEAFIARRTVANDNRAT